MTEVERLKQRLADMNVKNFHISRGNKPCTPEELAAEINKCLDHIEFGNCKKLFDFNYGLDFGSDEECKAFYELYPVPYWSMFEEGSRDTYLDRIKEYEELLPQRHKDFMVDVE